MCSQTRNSCAKAFDNRSRSKNLKPKNSRGGGVKSPPLKASRVKAFKNLTLVTRAEGAELRFGLRSFWWFFYFCCRLVARLALGTRSVKIMGSFALSFNFDCATRDLKKKGLLSMFFGFSDLIHFPPLHALYNHIVAVKATIDKQKSTCKIVVKVGGFCFDGRLLFVFQECQSLSKSIILSNWNQLKQRRVEIR